MILADGVSKYYGPVKAVDDVSFEVKEGENLVLLGTSGCGKTTTLKMLNRLLNPSAGLIKINGKDIMQQSPETLRRGIGYVLQYNSLFPHYTVAENIAVVPNLLKWDKNKIKARTDELIARLHLSPAHLQAYPHELSGGQQQRVNIARAVASDPPVLLMDEPFGALDNITRSNICREFTEIDEFMRKTIVMVTHDVQEAFQVGDRIMLMDCGKIVQLGTPADLLFHPKNEFVKNFFAASYLRLALGIVKIRDVWEQLRGSNTDTNTKYITANTTLWDALEQAVQGGDGQLLSVQNDDGQIKLISQEELFKAVSIYKAG